MSIEVSVVATPVKVGVPDAGYVVECSLCGPMGAYEAESTDMECIKHLQWHGVKVPLMYEGDE